MRLHFEPSKTIQKTPSSSTLVPTKALKSPELYVPNPAPVKFSGNAKISFLDKAKDKIAEIIASFIAFIFALGFKKKATQVSKQQK